MIYGFDKRTGTGGIRKDCERHFLCTQDLPTNIRQHTITLRPLRTVSRPRHVNIGLR